MTFDDIENLIESAWGHEEILREVETRHGMTREKALRWLEDICGEYCSGCDDDMVSHREACNIIEWVQRVRSAPPLNGIGLIAEEVAR